jgi:hypothetical protein
MHLVLPLLLANLPTATAHDVLILHSTLPVWADHVVATLLVDPRITTVDTRNASNATPTLAQLNAYDAVLVSHDANWSDPEALGNALASYVNGGGGVVLGAFSFNEGSQPMGAFLPYVPILSSSVAPVADTLTFDDPNSDVLAGVVQVDILGSSYTAGAPLAPGAHLVASYALGGTAVAEWSPDGLGTVVGVNLFPPDATQFPLSWDPNTDGGLLFANAIDVAARNAGTFAPTTFRGWAQGVCPGLIVMRSGFGTPGGDVILLSGQPGGTTVSAGPTCPGTAVPLTQVRRRLQLTADAWGTASYNPIVGAGPCGSAFVWVDLSTCAVSNVANLP